MLPVPSGEVGFFQGNARSGASARKLELCCIDPLLVRPELRRHWRTRRRRSEFVQCRRHESLLLEVLRDLEGVVRRQTQADAGQVRERTPSAFLEILGSIARCAVVQAGRQLLAHEPALLLNPQNDTLRRIAVAFRGSSASIRDLLMEIRLRLGTSKWTRSPPMRSANWVFTSIRTQDSRQDCGHSRASALPNTRSRHSRSGPSRRTRGTTSRSVAAPGRRRLARRALGRPDGSPESPLSL